MGLAPYVKTSWVNKVTKAGPTNFNHMEAGILSGQHLSGTLAQMTAALAIANPDAMYMATDIGNAFFKSNGATWDAQGIPLLTSALPTTPYEGQVIAYAPDWTLQPGVVWYLRYSPKKPDGSAEGSAYKWVRIGGSPTVWTGVGGNIATAVSTWTDIPSPATGQTPLAGDYMVRWSAYCTNNSSGNTSGGQVGLWALAAIQSMCTVRCEATLSYGNSVGASVRVNGLAVSAAAFKIQGWTDFGGINMVVGGLVIEITPIRVG